MIKVSAIPAFEDNYIWVIHLPNQKNNVIVIDPGDATAVLATLDAQKSQPLAILITHHHWDHIDGVKQLTSRYNIPVYGPANGIDCVTHPVSDGDKITLTASAKVSLELDVMAVPGHTLDHLAYYGQQMLFCGDTLFGGGCGRLFEGTPAQMYRSLQRLAALPDHTLVYCTHEYTVANLQFAMLVEPNNLNLKNRLKNTQLCRKKQQPSLPSTIEIEKQSNPFLRCHIEEIHHAAEQYSGKTLVTAEQVFSVIRFWKDTI